MAEEKKEVTPPEITGDELLKTAKSGDAPAEAPEASGDAPTPKAPPAEEKKAAPEPKAKSEAEIAAEVEAFMRQIAPDKPALRRSAPTDIKSSDGKTIDELVEAGRMAEAIQLGGTIAAKKEREMVMAELNSSQSQNRAEEIRREANRKVYLAHPELMDIDKGTKKHSDVPFASTIQQVYNEYPNLLQTPEGPLMAMEIAEKRLGIAKGPDTAAKQATESAVKQESARQDASRAAAAVASSSSSGRPPANDVGDVQLSDEEMHVAGKMGLTNVEYGKMRERKSVFGPDYYAKHRGGPRPRRG